MKKKLNVSLGDLIPVFAFLIIFIFFAIASKGRLVSAFNLKLIIDQSIQVILLACGMIFVVAQGSIDLSVGVNMAFSGVVGNYVAVATGIPFLIFPVTIIIGLLMGCLNGFLVSVCHVPSFMLSIAMLIGLRGVVTYILTIIQAQQIPDALHILNESYIKFPIFFVILIVVAYVLEYTCIGRYSKAIGENEETARNVGIPVVKMKWLVFIISGLMAAIGALFSLVSVGGTSMQMGSFMEMKVAMAIYFGGVLVTGGHTAKFYKIILGALSITLIINGLALIGMAESQISESVEGILLLVILFINIRVNNRKRKTAPEEETKTAAAGVEAGAQK